MSDKAIEVIADALEDCSEEGGDGHDWARLSSHAPAVLAAVREALKPIRELHRRAQLFELAIEPDCEDNDHDIFEDSTGEWCCQQCTDARPERECVCLHCSQLDTNGGIWPCATAELIYTAEELAQ